MSAFRGIDWDDPDTEEPLNEECNAIMAKRRCAWDDLVPSVQDAIQQQARKNLDAACSEAFYDSRIDDYIDAMSD